MMTFIVLIIGFLFNMILSLLHTAMFAFFLMKSRLKVDLSVLLLTGFYETYFIVNLINWIILYSTGDRDFRGVNALNSDFYVIDNIIFYLIVVVETYFIITMRYV